MPATSASPPLKYLPAAPRASSASSWLTRASATGADSPSHTPGKPVWGMKGKEWRIAKGSVNGEGFSFFMNDTELVWKNVSMAQ